MRPQKTTSPELSASLALVAIPVAVQVVNVSEPVTIAPAVIIIAAAVPTLACPRGTALARAVGGLLERGELAPLEVVRERGEEPAPAPSRVAGKQDDLLVDLTPKGDDLARLAVRRVRVVRRLVTISPSPPCERLCVS